MKKSSIAVVMVIVGLALAVSSAVALADGGESHQSAARGQYQNRHQVFVSQPVAATSSTLPFTGSELGIIVAVGLALAGAGFLLERTARKS